MIGYRHLEITGSFTFGDNTFRQACFCLAVNCSLLGCCLYETIRYPIMRLDYSEHCYILNLPETSKVL